MRKIFGIVVVLFFSISTGALIADSFKKKPEKVDETGVVKQDDDRDRDDRRGRHDGDRDRDDRRGRRDDDRDRRDHRDRRDRHSRQEARRILIDTNNILEQAQREAERGGYYEGLGRAYSHQREAKELYNRDRSYDRAVNHSLRAREIAKDIIQINRDIQRDKRRKPPRKDYNRHDDLDNSIKVKIIDDHAALKFKLKID